MRLLDGVKKSQKPNLQIRVKTKPRTPNQSMAKPKVKFPKPYPNSKFLP